MKWLKMWLVIKLKKLPRILCKNSLLYFDYAILGSTATHVTKLGAHA